MTKEEKQALKHGKRLMRLSKNITGVYCGYKYVGGKRTDTRAIVFTVFEKKSLDQATRDARAGKDILVPQILDGVRTDVMEHGLIEAYALTARRRPCPPGYSVGHVSITAGTLGAWVSLLNGDERFILSNNHVLAASNDTRPNEAILQPGKADGGFSGDDTLARLHEYALIRFEGDSGKGPKKNEIVAKAWWGLWKGVANSGAKAVRCPRRVLVVDSRRHAADARAVQQPYPNLVDAALAKPVTQGFVEEEMPLGVGAVAGIRDLELGDKVMKVGRTTEFTRGFVEGVGAQSRVSYGPAGVALFDDQVIIRGEVGEFSAGGDSGSAILTEDNFLGGLLFAGGSGITVANRISNVVAILGVRI